MTYTPSKSPILKLWKVFGSNSLGQYIVSKIVCIKAPYFNSIKPRFTKIQPGRVELKFRKRRAVLNHLKTIHAIAMCNAAELAAGVCLDVSLDCHYRWIPIGMEVQYLKKAKTDLRAVCHIENYQWEQAQEIIVAVSLLDTENDEVFSANIRMKISEIKKK